MISELDKEDKSRIQKLAIKEYEAVMTMMREVFLYQYMNSPNVISHLKRKGVGNRLDPFQRLPEICTPDSLDCVYSVYEDYRSIIQQVEDLGKLFTKVLHGWRVTHLKKSSHGNLLAFQWI